LDLHLPLDRLLDRLLAAALDLDDIPMLVARPLGGGGRFRGWRRCLGHRVLGRSVLGGDILRCRGPRPCLDRMGRLARRHRGFVAVSGLRGAFRAGRCGRLLLLFARRRGGVIGRSWHLIRHHVQTPEDPGFRRPRTTTSGWPRPSASPFDSSLAKRRSAASSGSCPWRYRPRTERSPSGSWWSAPPTCPARAVCVSSRKPCSVPPRWRSGSRQTLASSQYAMPARSSAARAATGA